MYHDTTAAHLAVGHFGQWVSVDRVSQFDRQWVSVDPYASV